LLVAIAEPLGQPRASLAVAGRRLGVAAPQGEVGERVVQRA
jgi:hypothetical protein